MNSYWKWRYPEYVGNVDFIQGIIAGVTAFAIWKDGKQFVGILEKELKEVILEIQMEMSLPEGKK